MWNTNDELVGQRILIDRGYDEEWGLRSFAVHGCSTRRWFEATVLAVSTTTANIKILTDDGDVMVGDQWEEV